VIGGQGSPSSIYAKFIDERKSHLSPNTITFYREKLAPFIIWCESDSQDDVRAIRRDHIAKFLSVIREGRRTRSPRPLTNGAIKLHHQVLKTFFNYVGETCEVGPSWANPVIGIKVKQSDAQTLEYSDDEVTKMFELTDDHADDFHRLRNRAIITVLINSGMRASELLGMKLRDIQPNGLIKVTGKGSKDRVVALGKSGSKAIDDYLVARGSDESILWLTEFRTPLTYQGLSGIMNRIEAADSIFADGVRAHRFRHTAITRLLRNRVPLRSVQRYAGHSNPQTTLRYAQALDAEEAIEMVNGW
jgi:site-specific recombinase XerD